VEQYNLGERECHMTRPNKPLKRGDIRSRTSDDLTAMVWRDKCDVYVLTNMHNPPATEGNFCDEHGNTLKLQIVQDYNQHIGYSGKGDRTTNSYSIQWQTWKWAKNFFFHLLDLTIVNSFLLTSWDAKTKQKFPTCPRAKLD
jgi:hypothetical protein